MKSPLQHKTWLCDLDNTLHNASAQIFPQISRAMRAHMCEHLELDEQEANRLRLHYWRRYGATLLGLMRHHGTDPGHFLHHTHQFANLPGMVVAERGVKAMLQRLPGRKILFSNAPRVYCETVLDVIGIRPCFDAVYTVERLRYQPKPSLGGFRRLLRGERLDPRRCIMVEDTLHNLVTAKRLGMKTVWVSACTRCPPCADVRVGSVLDLPGRLGKL